MYCSCHGGWLLAISSGGKTSCCMQITDGLSNSWEFVDIVQSVGLTCVGRLKEVIDGLSCWDLVSCIGGLGSTWGIKDKCVMFSLMINCWSGICHRPVRGQW